MESEGLIHLSFRIAALQYQYEFHLSVVSPSSVPLVYLPCHGRG